METHDAGTGAAVAVLLAILGLIIMIGLILLMMWKQPGIEHSPSQQGRLCAPAGATETLLPRGRQLIQLCATFRGDS